MKKNNLKRTLALATSAFALSAAFVGCTDYTAFSEGEMKQVLYNQQYDEAFIKQFGQPDPNQDWGMNEKIGSIGAFSSVATRAGESDVSQVLVNRNQWTEFDSKSSVTFPNYGTNTPTVTVPSYKTTALGHDIQIPGFPHLNGLYYTANGNTLDPSYKTGDQITSGSIPAGDITPYEIQYVSNWFRTHPNPKSISLHLSDFFIQNVSCDFDQVEYKESGYALYQDGWPNTGDNGKNISTLEEAKAHKTATGGTYATNLTEPISYDLDYLGFQDMAGTWTHVNNFNRGNSNFSPEDNASNPNREIKYVKSAGTENFTCRSSWSTSNNEASKWVLVYLTWNETVKHDNSPYNKGTVIPREGYYLAFDFAGQKGDQIVNPDGYYSNWIIKITPGHFTPTGNSKRMFCEDLGGSFDFDFNDAVVDVAFERTKGNYDEDPEAEFTPIISVQAAGGTMPIYVEQTGADYELHKMLGSDKLTPINVETSATHATAIYRGKPVKKAQSGQIHIYVDNTKNNTKYMIHGADADEYDNERSEVDKEYGTHNGSTASPTLNGINVNSVNKTMVAPCAFSAPTSVKWMKEMKNIGTAYKDFMSWVNSKSWITAGTGAKWYENVTNGENLLYTPSFNVDGPTSTTGSNDSFTWRELFPDESDNAVSAATAVHADSYMKLQAFTGNDAIWKELDKMTDNQRVTYTVILSSSTLYNDLASLKGILVPADYVAASEGVEAKMKYGDNTFTYATLNPINSAAYVPTNHDFCSAPTTCNGTDGHNCTYTLQFSFAKSDLVKSRTTVEGKEKCTYLDYLFLFLKVGNNGVGSGTTIGQNGDVTIQKWYVHY